MSDWFPPPSRPRPVEGGIKARSKRGAIAQTWWSERFIEVLESIGVGSRLQRGRGYARKGQVISLHVAAGVATASVQGSRARPYRVRIGLAAFGKSEWARLERALAGSAWYTAKLLAGEMPEDIEEVFAAAGLSLFPASAGELSMDCSCPDWQVPCKHLAATCYLLAESFDDDPFAILAWRGRERRDLLDNLRAARSGGPPAVDLRAAHSGNPAADLPGARSGGPADLRGARSGVPPAADLAGSGAAALADSVASYFSARAEIPLRGPAQSPSDALLDQLPAVDLAIRGRNIVQLLRPAYLALGEGQEPHDRGRSYEP